MFDILNTTKQKSPIDSLKLSKIKREILGKKYELSLVLTNNKLSKKLNKKYRQEDKATNILSFPLSKNSGEIFMDLKQTEKESKNYGIIYKKFFVFVFVHGLLHLKGLDHGILMSKKEKMHLEKLKVEINGNLKRFFMI